MDDVHSIAKGLERAHHMSNNSERLMDIGDIPADAGAYVLAIKVAAPLMVHIGTKFPVPLSCGRYLYCGSAKGPGGIRARIAHHLRRGKSIHWHIDQLTEAATVVDVWAFPGGNECDLITALSLFPAAIRGFGSTDCRRCASHLLQWPEGANIRHRLESYRRTVTTVSNANQRTTRL